MKKLLMRRNVKGIFIYTLGFFLLLACKNSKTNVLLFNSKKDIVLPYLSDTKFPGGAKLCFAGTDTFIVFRDKQIRGKQQCYVRLYDVKKNLYVDSIDLNLFEHYVNIQDFNYINSDSIILAYNTSYLADYHDHAIVIINRKKELLAKANFRGAPVLLYEQNNEVKRDFFCYSMYRDFPIIYKYGFILSSLAFNEKDKFGDRVREENFMTMGKLYFDSTRNYKGIYTIDTHYRDIYFPPKLVNFRGAWNGKNQVVFAYGYSGKVHILDLEKETISTRYVDFISIDTIKPRKEAYENYDDPYQAEYSKFYYDPFKNVYYWLARLPLDENFSPLFCYYPQYAIVMLDDQMNKLGEGMLPFGCTYPIIPLKEGLLVYNKHKSDSLERIVFEKLEVGVQKMQKEFIKEMIIQQYRTYNKKSLTESDYLNKICGLSEYFSNFLLINIDISCPCVTLKLGDFLKANPVVFEEKKMALILISDKSQKVDRFIEKYCLETYKGSHIFSDTEKVYYTVFPRWGNIKYLIVKNHIVELKGNFASGNLTELFSILTE
jgi:hypothetical protein